MTTDTKVLTGLRGRLPKIGLRGHVLIIFAILAAFSLANPLLILRQSAENSEKLDWVIHTHNVISTTKLVCGAAVSQ
jgi:hypothetical protein